MPQLSEASLEQREVCIPEKVLIYSDLVNVDEKADQILEMVILSVLL
jgi:hypothetical protein